MNRETPHTDIQAGHFSCPANKLAALHLAQRDDDSATLCNLKLELRIAAPLGACDAVTVKPQPPTNTSALLAAYSTAWLLVRTAAYPSHQPLRQYPPARQSARPRVCAYNRAQVSLTADLPASQPLCTRFRSRFAIQRLHSHSCLRPPPAFFVHLVSDLFASILVGQRAQRPNTDGSARGSGLQPKRVSSNTYCFSVAWTDEGSAHISKA
eukprot:2736626-Pleurochrysis_carterae.AAC.2